MDFKQLRSFVAVADCGSFTQAAAQLYTSQPTVSAHIRQLEEELQQRLFLRTTKSLSITPHGRELYDYAVQVLSQQERLLSGWRQNDRLVCLGTSSIPSAYLLPELLSRFGALHPDVSFDIHQSDSEDVLRALRAGRFDLGLTGLSVPDDELAFTPLCQDAMVLIAPNTPELSAARADGASLSALLQAYPLLLREAGSGSQHTADALLRAAGLEPDTLRVAARLNDQESIKNLVAAGLGLAIVSARSVAREAARGDLLGDVVRVRGHVDGRLIPGAREDGEHIHERGADLRVTGVGIDKKQELFVHDAGCSSTGAGRIIPLRPWSA